MMFVKVVINSLIRPLKLAMRWHLWCQGSPTFQLNYIKMHKISFFFGEWFEFPLNVTRWVQWFCMYYWAKLTILVISEKYEMSYKSMFQVNGDLDCHDITDSSKVANLRGWAKELMTTLKNHLLKGLSNSSLTFTSVLNCVP